MSEIWSVTSVKKNKKKRTLLHGLDEVSQLLHVGQHIFADSHQDVWQAGHKGRPSVGKL